MSTQGSWGGKMILTHNWPYVEGDTATIRYKSKQGQSGELIPSLFDATTIEALMPESVFGNGGIDWSFVVSVTGIRPQGNININSEILKKTFTATI